MGRLDGKSSLGRLGLLVHSTAGFIDPGFQGGIVLEFSNICATADHPLRRHAHRADILLSHIQPCRTALRPRLTRQQVPRPGCPNTQQVLPKLYYGGPQGSDSVALRQWLKDSSFAGNVRELSIALDVPLKTVEDWVYGRRVPNAENRRRLFTLTRLSQFAPRQDASRQQTLKESSEP